MENRIEKINQFIAHVEANELLSDDQKGLLLSPEELNEVGGINFLGCKKAREKNSGYNQLLCISSNTNCGGSCMVSGQPDS